MTEYRASFDASIRFGNGGDLAVHGFRVDVPGRDVSDGEIAALFVASLGLLMTEAVELDNVEVFTEPHKGTRGGPSDRTAAPEPRGGRLAELGHVIRDGLPEPHITPSLVPLERTVDLPAVVLRLIDLREPGIGVGALAPVDVRGRAVLLHVGDSARVGTPAYGDGRHFLTRDGAAWLVDHGAALVGIDAVDIDDIEEPERPARTLLLGAGIPIVEHLAGLDQLPPTGARFTAVPLRVAGLDTVPVRAFARVG